jgi:glycosyltransferase involved in cell wall biosynthesis
MVEWLELKLRDANHDVERVYLPQVDEPHTLFAQSMAFRWVDLASADRLICFRPQSFYIPHPHKIVWMIHHVRTLYDLWDSPYRSFPDNEETRAIRDAVRQSDRTALTEARRIYTNSTTMSERLRAFNGLDSSVLYPPVLEPERYGFRAMNNEILYVGRVEHAKRVHLLVESMAYTTQPVQLRICGEATQPDYAESLRSLIHRFDLHDSVRFDDRWVPETEKQELMANCLAVAYLPLNEDSYGYTTIEAAHSEKPVVTTSDSGGLLEFVIDSVTGCVAAPNPQSIAAKFDALCSDPTLARVYGKGARRRIDELGISWNRVLDALLT